MKPQYSYYNQVTCTRDISGDNFNRGQMNFHWDNEGQSMFNPARSYFRVRCKLTNAAGTAPLFGDADIAPNMYLMDNIFQQMRMRVNGQTVSEIADYIPQISALKRRIQQSEHRSRILGQTMEFSSGSFYARQSEVCPSCFRSNANEPANPGYMGAGTTGAVIGKFERPAAGFANARITFVSGPPDTITVDRCAYKMSDLVHVGQWLTTNNNGGQRFQILSIVDTDDGGTMSITVGQIVAAGQANIAAGNLNYANGHIVLPKESLTRGASEFELIWHPCMGFWQINDFLCGKFNFELTPQTNALMQQYVIESLLPTTNADYAFEVVSMILYAYTGYTNKPYTGTLNFSMQECEMQQQNLTTASLTNKTFSVQPNTFALTLAIQTGLAGDSRYPLTKFKLPLEEELKLVRYYIQYKGIMLPRTIPDPQFIQTTSVNEFSIDYTKHNYYEMLQYSGAFDKTDCEDLFTWQQKGPFYHYEWPLQENAGTEVAVSTQFNWDDAATTINESVPTVLLFSHYLTRLSIRCESGRCKSVNA